ncbi:NEW3 domain-containing protein [Paenibacillus gansuensis]|uniref:NEW3 domain-containing protein n=1 Tax=Paenibacillus gansuensis TaxID=306542 RepID=A0ABW5PB49_9BACL
MKFRAKLFKKAIGVVAAVLLLQSVLPFLYVSSSLQAAPDRSIRYIESFASGRADGWKLSSASWKVSTVSDAVYGESQVLSQGVNGSTPDTALTGDASWTDYTVRSSIRPKNTAANGGSAILFRAADTKNYYWVRFYRAADQTAYLQLMRTVNGTVSSIGQKPYAWQDGTWYDVQIQAAGTVLKVSVNGSAELSYTDKSAAPLLKGGIGFRTYLSEAEIDRVEVNGTLSLPARELGVQAVVTGSGIRLQWQPFPEPEAASYVIRKGIPDAGSGSASYSDLIQVSLEQAAQGVVDSAVEPEGSYSYIVQALDVNGAAIGESAPVSAQYSPDSQRLYIDSFNDGSADGWSLGSGSWVTRQAAGPAGTESYVLAQSRNSQTTEYSFLGGSDWSEYSAEFDMRSLNTSPGGSSSILFRAKDAKNYYMFRFVKTTSSAYVLQTFKALEGKLTTLAQRTFAWKEGDWYRVKVTVSGSGFQVYLNEEKMADIQDTTNPLLTGGIGLRTYLTEMEIDRVKAEGRIAPPRQDYGLRSKIDNGRVLLEWKPSAEPEAYRYQVFRGRMDAVGGTFSYEPVSGLVSETSFTDPAALAGESYSYYIEVSDQLERVFSRSYPTTVTPLQEETLAVLQNGIIKVEFVRTAAAGTEPFIGKRIYLADGSGGWLQTPVNPVDEKMAVIYSPDVKLGKNQFETDNQQTHPVWTNVSGNSTPNLFEAGTTYWVRPSTLEQQGGQVLLRAADQAGSFQLEQVWSLAPDAGWPKVEQTLIPGSAGYWSVISEGFFNKPLNEVEYLQLGFLINQKRLPAEPYTVPEYQLPNPVVLAQAEVEGAGPVNFGLVPDRSEIPPRMAKLETSRFGLLISGPNRAVQPGLAAPLLGTELSKMAAGQSFTFTYHYIVEKGQWADVYEKVARTVFGFGDYRTSWNTSVTDTIHNLIDLMMDDVYSGWWARAKGYKDIEILNSVKHGNTLAAYEAYLLTGNEDIYRRRVLPLTEFLISRSDRVYSPIADRKGASAISELGGETTAYGAAALMPAYEMGRQSSGILHEKALSELDSGRKASLEDYIAAYKTTKKESYLTAAKQIADQIVTAELAPGQTYTLSGTQFVFLNWPDWEGLMDLYELTGEQRYLDGVKKAADLFLTSVWMQPVPGKEQVTVPSSVHRSPYVHWTGGRIGWPYDLQAIQQTTEGWIPSQAGLTLEQGITYEDLGGNGVIMNPGWAGYLMRLSQLSGKALYKDAARSSIVGRNGNYPGYYYRQFSVNQMDPLYPYKGPDITEIYYHHIPIQLGLTVDFLLSDMMYRAGGAIRFEGETDPGLSVGNNQYLWFRSKYYGHKPGEMYGRTGMHLWLPKGLVNTGNPQVSWLTATDGSTMFIPLLNYDDKPQTVNVKLNTALAGAAADGTLQVLDEQGRALPSAAMKAGVVNVTIPAKGMRTLRMDGVTGRTKAMDWGGSGLSPDQQKLSFRKDETATNELGTIESALLIHEKQNYDAYVYTTAKDDIISEAVLHYNAGKGWTRSVNNQFPFEFSVGPLPQEQPFQYILETRTLSGEVHSSEMRQIQVTNDLAWQQSRLTLQLNAAEKAAAAVTAGKPANQQCDLVRMIQTLKVSGARAVSDTAGQTAEKTNVLLQFLRDLQKVKSSAEKCSPLSLRGHSASLHQALDMAHSVVQQRLGILIPVSADEAITSNRLFQGDSTAATVTIGNGSSYTVTEGKLTLQLPSGWSSSAGTTVSVPQLLPGGQNVFQSSLTVSSSAPPGTYLLPAVLQYKVNNALLTKPLQVKADVVSKLRLELQTYKTTVLAGEPAPIQLTLRNDGTQPVSGNIVLELPAQWRADGDLAYSNLAAGGTLQRTITVTPDPNLQASEQTIAISAQGTGAQSPKVLWKATGTRNVALSALGSQATASTELVAAHSAMKAIDGGYSSPQAERWISLDSETIHDLVINFGKPRTIGKIIVRHMGTAGDPSFNTADFQLQTAASPSGPWTDLVTPVTGNTDSVTEHTFTPVTTSYIRLHITKGSPRDNYARIYEVEAILAGPGG